MYSTPALTIFRSLLKPWCLRNILLIQAMSGQAFQNSVGAMSVCQNHLAVLRLSGEPSQELRLGVSNHNGWMRAFQHSHVIPGIPGGDTEVRWHAKMASDVL
mmetsp:Transcript_19552/g.35251  ORF Transcript_19552/g.35251 Transcript_19552/m.35251 type:complete len:102 (+) Transcript_19552:695-1000(+)